MTDRSNYTLYSETENNILIFIKYINNEINTKDKKILIMKVVVKIRKNTTNPIIIIL